MPVPLDTASAPLRNENSLNKRQTGSYSERTAQRDARLDEEIEEDKGSEEGALGLKFGMDQAEESEHMR
jgi:hypothetical protein